MPARGRAGAVLAAAGLAAALVAGPALPARAADCVALVVDPAPGAARAGCVTWSAGLTGVQVLQRAGHFLQFRSSDGLLCRIDGVPGTCTADATHYWSYWHRAPGGSGWAYSNEGAGTYQPARNSTEGWAYLDGGSRQPANLAFSTICPQAAPPPTRTTPRHSTAPPPPRSSHPPAGSRPAPTTGGRPTATSHPGPVPPRGSRSPAAARSTTSTPPSGTAGASATGVTATAGTPPGTSAPARAAGTGGTGGGPPVAALAGLVLVAAVAGAGFWFARNRRAGPP